MWTGGCHYEVVGRLLAGNQIQREFDHTDPLIERLYTYLCEPQKIPDKYPKLVSYLPKELRVELGFEKNDFDDEEMVKSDFEETARSDSENELSQ